MENRPILLGVAGGSGSGKTTVVRRIIAALGAADEVGVIHHDSYYRDASALPPDERALINYDHPDSLETDLLIRHLEALLRGEPVEVPVYDFTNHVRTRETERVEPRPVVIVDGILILWDRTLRDLMDVKIFVDADADVRLARRLRRDVQERGRNAESVLDQYMETVRPMHLEFVEPSKRYADVILPRGGHNRVGVQMVVDSVKGVLGREPPARGGGTKQESRGSH
ncbi:MAG: uridine kinase [Gemmatimonadetes bacterium]|nr:uridine kinase [Gemmatimonadota bacterium]